MIKTLSFTFLIAFISFSKTYSQYYDSTQLDSIQLNRKAFEGDLYLDTVKGIFKIGLTQGTLGDITDEVLVGTPIPNQNPGSTGVLYFSDSVNKLYAFSGSQWIDISTTLFEKSYRFGVSTFSYDTSHKSKTFILPTSPKSIRTISFDGNSTFDGYITLVYNYTDTLLTISTVNYANSYDLNVGLNSAQTSFELEALQSAIVTVNENGGQKTLNFNRLGLPTRKVENELLFHDGNYIYISFMTGKRWKVIRYDRSDINTEGEATITNNPTVLFQPITFATMQGLNY